MCARGISAVKPVPMGQGLPSTEPPYLIPSESPEAQVNRNEAGGREQNKISKQMYNRKLYKFYL